MTRRITFALAATGLVTVAAIPARRTLLRWGATGDERTTQLPGDEFLPVADLTATRAITVRRPPEAVWPWLAQLGQQHGGFYSYDFLENLIGCGIHSADSIVAEWQSADMGDQVDLAPGVGLTVAAVEPARSLVLRGAPAILDRPAPYDFTWAFVLREGADGTTRLIARERYLRDLLLSCADAEVFRPVWQSELEAETVRNVPVYPMRRGEARSRR